MRLECKQVVPLLVNDGGLDWISVIGGQFKQEIILLVVLSAKEVVIFGVYTHVASLARLSLICFIVCFIYRALSFRAERRKASPALYFLDIEEGSLEDSLSKQK